MANSIVQWGTQGYVGRWEPTTLQKIGKDEEFLENVLATDPDLLGITSRTSGIQKPYQVFRQVSLPTPTGRTVAPDISMLYASGHLVIVEVKRYGNPELKDRSVIAQIVDYASSFASLSDADLCRLFRSKDSTANGWHDVVRECFPEDSDAEELASVLRKRIANGDIHLVIACDKIPPGVPELVAGLASQSALGFTLELVEVAPFVSPGSSDEILFVPTPRLVTEIVSRTAVTVTYQQGDAQPSTKVETASVEDIEQNLQATKSATAALYREWSPAEVEAAIRDAGDPIDVALLEFAMRESAGGQFVTPGAKRNAGYAFYIAVPSADGSTKNVLVFSKTLTSKPIYVFFNRLQKDVSQPLVDEFRNRLQQLFGGVANFAGQEVSIPLEAVGAHRAEFEQAMLWLRNAVVGLTSPIP